MATSDHSRPISGAPNPTLEAAFRDKLVFKPSGEPTPLHSNISRQEASVLYDVVRQRSPATSLEIGLGQGISTLAILQALHDNAIGAHHVIDPFQKSFENVGLEMVQRAGLSDRFIFHERFPEETIPSLPALQFAFIDSSHLYDLTLAEFVLVDKKMEVSGVIGFHDLWMRSLQTLFRYIVTNRAYRIHPASHNIPFGRPSLKVQIKEALGSLLSKLPRARSCFRSEILKPWSSWRLPYLAFLEKVDQDKREWTFHEPF